ncbi:class I SAM-dependent methyltransferase [Candidatus Bathyarchaeota archaeon]|nr:class I SAM-dependent methyltransferase [Candidatus Bathyarchaeota archaeon]
MIDNLPKFFWKIHSGLPREGPGDNESTRKAYEMLKNLPEKPRILDVGCGPGMQTIELAKLSRGQIVALDFHKPFLEQLKETIQEEELTDIIKPVKGDMFNIEYSDGSFNVVWSEGAIYIIGFEKGLQEWRRLLASKGYVVVSELTWLRHDMPEEVNEYITHEYPAIKTLEENIEVVQKSGYRLLDSFVLPVKSWWDNYYGPIEAKLSSLKARYSDYEEAMQVITMHEIEIEMFRKYSDYYGYVFYVMQIE